MADTKPTAWKAATLTVLTVLAAAVGVWGYLQPEDPPAVNRFYLRNSAGPVVFNHRAHQQSVDGCAGCHHEQAAGLAAAGCRGCHPVAAPEGAPVLDCGQCHDDPDYAPGVFAHEELIEIHPDQCDGCHTARSVADAYHLQCNRCHLATAPGRFAGDDGQPACKSCHLR